MCWDIYTLWGEVSNEYKNWFGILQKLGKLDECVIFENFREMIKTKCRVPNVVIYYTRCYLMEKLMFTVIEVCVIFFILTFTAKHDFEKYWSTIYCVYTSWSLISKINSKESWGECNFLHACYSIEKYGYGSLKVYFVKFYPWIFDWKNNLRKSWGKRNVLHALLLIKKLIWGKLEVPTWI